MNCSAYCATKRKSCEVKIMRILILCEHDGKSVRLGSRSAVAFGNAVAEQAKGSVE